jgi:signal transduction histidine kinase
LDVLRTTEEQPDGAIVEPVLAGTTSGLTALDRARHGRAESLRLMVVAGDARVVEACATIGYTMVRVSAEEVIGELAARHFHAALLDADGLGAAAGRVLESLGQVTPPTPSIVIESHSDDAGARAWLERGADDHLDRLQLSPPVLRRAVESAVARSRARELRRRLEHADRLAAIGTLAAGVAHEVNNPAAYVLMNLKTCREHIADLRSELLGERQDLGAGGGVPVAHDERAEKLDEMAEMLADNVRGVERIVGIVQALRSYARSEPDEIGAVDVAAVCRDAFDLVGNQLRHGARLSVDLAPVPPIAADARKLGQVVINLLVNAGDAVAAADERPHEIALRCVARDGRVEISVSDTGVGIPASHRSRIYEPFFTTKPRGSGSGLGLAIVRDIVERFGGRIAVDSTPGRGTTFTVRFPIDSRGAGARPAAAAKLSHARGHVLIIDDEVALTSALRRQLRGHHDVTVINDGAAGLAAILRQDFDVILCDIMMPGTDGLVVLETLRRSRPDMVPRLVLMTAGVFADPMRERVLSAGGQLLDKPVPLETLLAMIDATRGRRR